MEGSSLDREALSGLNVKNLREIIKFRKQDQDERDEYDSLLDVYMRAMDWQAQPLWLKRLEDT